jgi:hypothetical protein
VVDRRLSKTEATPELCAGIRISRQVNDRVLAEGPAYSLAEISRFLVAT